MQYFSSQSASTKVLTHISLRQHFLPLNIVSTQRTDLVDSWHWQQWHYMAILVGKNSI